MLILLYKNKTIFQNLAKSIRNFHPSRFGIFRTSVQIPISKLSSGVVEHSRRIIRKMEIAPELLKQHTVPLNQPVVALDCEKAFNGLSLKEKLYAHYLSQACWVGSLIVTVQTSPESPIIFRLIHDAFKTNGVEGLKEIAVNRCGFKDEEWQAFLVYSCGVINGLGNYKSSGDTKIIPALPSNKFERLLKSCKLSETGTGVEVLWDEIKERVYSFDEKSRQLGLGEKGITTYFSSNCTTKDAELIARFLREYKIEPWNTRAFKITDGSITTYEIRSASSELNEGSPKTYDFEGSKFILTRGDYSPLMKFVSDYLSTAREHALNDEEKEMLRFYIESFTKGSLDAHKDGSRQWIKDQGPCIETYIGFIENYRDPVGARSEFEGFVSMVNKPMSEKFGALVMNADSILKLLPWPSAFERKTFVKPDFTSLDILTFAGSGIPSGINIPNYDEIRQHEGFKNVTLGNVIPANFKNVDLPFFSKEDKKLLNTYFVEAYELQTGLHELLGHGSGLNFVKNEDGTSNLPADLRNPINQELVESMYLPGETYNSVFCDLGSPYEECRAETIGLFLSLSEDVLKIFGLEGQEAINVRNCNWMTGLYDGIRSLEMYQPSTSTWMQAHSQAAFVTLQVLIEAGENLVEIKETVGADGKPDLLARLDLDAINTVGRKAFSNFILKLQVYKSTADITSARKMFEAYSRVSDDGLYPWASWRSIVLDRKLPRKMFVQPNTYIAEDGQSVRLTSYPCSPEGLIQSFIERFHEVDMVDIYQALETCYNKDRPFFP